MDYWWFHSTTIGVTSFIASTICLIRYKQLDKASKYLVLSICLFFLVEQIATWASVRYRQSNIVYNIHGPIDLLITSVYFNTIIESFRKKNVGIKIALVGFIFALINVLFFQNYKILNTYFLLLQSLLVVFMCLYYYYDFLKKDTYKKQLPIHFWFTAILFVYWSFTNFHWSIGLKLMYSKGSIAMWPNYIILFITTCSYLGFSVLFWNYNKFGTSERG